MELKKDLVCGRCMFFHFRDSRWWLTLHFFYHNVRQAYYEIFKVVNGIFIVIHAINNDSRCAMRRVPYTSCGICWKERICEEGRKFVLHVMRGIIKITWMEVAMKDPRKIINIKYITVPIKKYKHLAIASNDWWRRMHKITLNGLKERQSGYFTKLEKIDV